MESAIVHRVRTSVQQLLQRLSEDAVKRLLVMRDYHGFAKTRLPAVMLQEILQPFDVSPNDIQVEIVRVDGDLSSEIHEHRQAHATIVVLGADEKVPEPVNAAAFLGDRWFPIRSGDALDIPPGTPHGFTVNHEGIVFFLSVQAPPIERADGDDYYRL